MPKRLRRIIGLLGIAAIPMAAQNVAPPTDPAKPEADPSLLVRLTVEPSRTQSTLGTRLGLMAEIQNVSQTPLRFYEHETVFIVPPETRIYGTNVGFEGCSFFPTQANPRVSKAKDPRGYDVVIQPGEAYRVFWDFGSDGCRGLAFGSERYSGDVWGWWKLQWQRVMFSPGPYKVTLSAKFYDAASKEETYHTAAASREVVLSAPQTMLLLGTALGGMLGLLVKRYLKRWNQPQAVEPSELPEPDPEAGLVQRIRARLPAFLRRTWSLAVELGGASLLSVILVVLASRLSDVFPVTVNVNDFWGAISLGFIGHFSGMAMLSKLVPETPEPGTATGTVAPEPQPEGGGDRPSTVGAATPSPAAARAAGASAGGSAPNAD